MKRARIGAFFVLFFVLAFGGAAAADSSSGFPIVSDISPALWGADIGIGYRGFQLFPGVDTVFWLYGGGAYEQMSYRRNPDGTMIIGAAPGGVDPAADTVYDRWSGRWQLGIVQGLAWNTRTDDDLLEAFVFYRGRIDDNLQAGAGQLIFLSSLPDRMGLFQNAVLAGLAYDDIMVNAASQTGEGISAEASVEWGPEAFFNAVFGRSDYLRFNATGRAFFPAFDAFRDDVDSIFSTVYLCGFFSADYVFGAYVPLNVRQTFGGMDPRTGLGGAIRGVDAGAMDANLKMVVNLELRVNFPDILGMIPGFLMYWDGGYFNQIGEAVAQPAGGFVSSAGVGVYLSLFGLTAVTLYGNARITGVNADGGHFSYGLEFSSKF
jgi:hypothetical protein